MLRDALSHLPPIYSCDAVRQIERRYLANATPSLMERAGAAASAEALRMMRGCRGRVLVAAGPGNNGGDAFVVARHLYNTGYDVMVAFAGDPKRLTADAGAAYAAWKGARGEIIRDIPDQSYSLVIDGLFGIGLQRPVTGQYADWIERINQFRCPVLALDIPSGLDSDTGCMLGNAVRATHTATFIALKPGLLTLDGPDCCGTVSVHDLGLDCESVQPADGHVLETNAFARHLKPRLRNSHKGTNGNAVIIGGARGMAGAALLAGRAALKSGAGRVYLGMLDDQAITVDTTQPELMLRPPLDLVSSHAADALAVGPGLGDSEAAKALLRQCLGSDCVVVLDADALNLMARHEALAQAVLERKSPTILTPHPAEAARLLGKRTEAVQMDRVAAALELAGRFQASVVLKGCGSVVAFPTGQWLINASGNPGLSSAGMGDVLTGVIASLIAQGWPADSALLGGVHLHGRAADELVRQGTGPNGLTATDVIDAIRTEINRLLVRAPDAGAFPALNDESDA